MNQAADLQPQFVEHPFWKFSLRVYAHKIIEQQCLFLQNEYGLNVNVLLFSAWQAIENKRLLASRDYQFIQETTEQWNKKVQTLRTLRHKLKNFSDSAVEAQADINEKLKNIELAAEYIEQTMLASLSFTSQPTSLTTPFLVEQNLYHYSMHLKLEDATWASTFNETLHEVLNLKYSVASASSVKPLNFLSKLRAWFR
ncbi:MAG: TIGR02444 family protein [Pseudomonadota bacterium]